MPKKPQPVIFNVIWPARIQCGACVAVCLQREPFISPFDTIAIETPWRIACMRCVEVCPTSAITYRTLNSSPDLPSTRGETTLPLSAQENEQELGSA